MPLEDVGVRLVAEDGSKFSSTMSKASGDLKGLTKSVEGTEKSAVGLKDSFKNSFTEMRSQIELVKSAYSIFAQTFTQVMDWGREGAAINQTTESFDFLIQKLGAYPDLLDQITDASNNTISEQEAMSSTMTLLAGASGDLATELANATPRLMEIAKAANKLNPSLGTTSFMYQSIATGVKRAQPLILDNLGLTLKVGDANEVMAKQLGKSVEQLTADEKAMAILNATLKAGDTMIAQVGGTTESATDSFQQMDVAVKEAGDALKSKFAPFIGEAAKAITHLITRNQELADILKTHKEDVLLTADSYEDYAVELERAAKAAQMHIDKNGQLVNGQLKVVDSTYLLTEEAWKNAQAAEAAATQTAAWDEHEKKLFTSLTNVIPVVETTTAKVWDVDTAMRSFTSSLLYNIAAQGLDKEQAWLLAESMGLIEAATSTAMAMTDELRTTFDEAGADAAIYRDRIDKINDAINALKNRDIVITVTTVRREIIEQEYRSGVQDRATDPEDPYNRLGGQASGGPVRPNSAYLVGERGPEILRMGNQGGRIIPNSDMNPASIMRAVVPMLATISSQISNVYSTTNEYNLGVNTMNSPQVVQNSFAIMKMLG